MKGFVRFTNSNKKGFAKQGEALCNDTKEYIQELNGQMFKYVDPQYMDADDFVFYRKTMELTDKWIKFIDDWCEVVQKQTDALDEIQKTVTEQNKKMEQLLFQKF